MKKKTILILLHILLAPIVVIEYMAFLWMWAGDGVFMLVSVPIFFLIFLGIHGILIYRFKNNKLTKAILIHSCLLITPLISAGCSLLLADALGMAINIM